MIPPPDVEVVFTQAIRVKETGDVSVATVPTYVPVAPLRLIPDAVNPGLTGETKALPYVTPP